jgi:hypothetical protein
LQCPANDIMCPETRIHAVTAQEAVFHNHPISTVRNIAVNKLEGMKTSVQAPQRVVSTNLFLPGISSIMTFCLNAGSRTPFPGMTATNSFRQGTLPKTLFARCVSQIVSRAKSPKSRQAESQ